MANKNPKIENLKPIKDSKTARKLQQKSSKKQKENNLKRKSLKEQLEILMKLPLSSKQDKLKKQIKELGISDNEINMQMAMNVAIYQQALKGNTKAYEIVRDTLGEKPVEKVENINPPVINIERPKK